MKNVSNWINTYDNEHRGDIVRKAVTEINNEYTPLYQDYVTELMRVSGYRVSLANDVDVPVEVLLSLVADQAYQLGYMTAVRKTLNNERRRFMAQATTDISRETLAELFDDAVRELSIIDNPVETFIVQLREQLAMTVVRMSREKRDRRRVYEQQVSPVLRQILPHTSAKVIIEHQHQYRQYLALYRPELLTALDNRQVWNEEQLQQSRSEWNYCVSGLTV